MFRFKEKMKNGFLNDNLEIQVKELLMKEQLRKLHNRERGLS